MIELWDWRRTVTDLYADIRREPDPRLAWQHWRATRDRLFATHPQSPVADHPRPIPLFNYDPTLRFLVALSPATGTTEELPAGADGVIRMRPFARTEGLHPALGGELTLFWIEGYGGGAFLPFADATSGHETYGAGRYLLDTIKGADLGQQEGKLVLDFNFAYQPSCAYSDRWTCPLARRRTGCPVPSGRENEFPDLAYGVHGQPRIPENTMRLGLLLAALAFATPALAADPTPVTTQLGWLRIGEYAPILVADAKGYFTEEGIAHRIIDGGPGKNPIPIVAVGQAQFGLTTSGLNVIGARTARDPVDVVAVGTLFQVSPSSYFKLANPGDPPATPKDLEGHSAGVAPESEYMLRALAKKNGVDMSKVTVKRVGANAEPLMVGQVDFFNGWIVNQTYQVEQEAAKADAPANLKGKTWRAIVLSEWGMRSYGDVIVASGKTVRENPELIRHYLRAVARGMQFILDHPEDAVDVVAKFPGQIEDAKKLAWRFKLQNPLLVNEDTKVHGLLWMNPDVWRDMGQLLKDDNQIASVPPVAEMMTNAFIAGTKLD